MLQCPCVGGKSGTGRTAPDKTLNWLVGYVERGGRRWFYAMNVDAKEGEWWSPTERIEKVRGMIDAVGVLPRRAVTRESSDELSPAVETDV